MNFFKSLFSSEGEVSSKRVLAFMLIIAGIIYAFIKSDPVMCSILIGAGTTLLGVMAITKT